MTVISRPILFNGDMIRAILSGQKTQTRRVIKNQPPFEIAIVESSKGSGVWGQHKGIDWGDPEESTWSCPYGIPEQQLWVRETWRPALSDTHRCFAYRADNSYQCGKQMPDPPGMIKWKPSIFMPREASRITLEILDIRVERLQQIKPKDAIAEGVTFDQYNDPLSPCDEIRALNAFRDLWDSINAKRGYGWDADPWVWAIEFKREVAA